MLRDYQRQAIESIETSFEQGNKNVILCMPTGSGKTVTFAEIARRYVEANADKHVLILTDRIELLSQSGGALRKAGLNVGFIAQGVSAYLPNTRVLVGMIETYYRRLQKGWHIKDLGLMIIDEAHKGNFKKIIRHHQNDNLRIIGATATPLSSSKKDPLKNYYQAIVVGTDIPALIGLGFLATPTYYAVKASITAKIGNDGDYKLDQLYQDFNKPTMYDGVVLAYQKHALGKKTLIFCVNIEHTKQTCQKFLEEGYPAKFLVSEDITSIERKQTLKWFAETPDAILVNASILTTGFDEPSIQCVILNRATQSLPLYLQMIGRAARVLPAKNRFIVIDMGNNLYTHKAWELQRDWEYMFWKPEQPRKKQDNAEFEMVEDTKQCPECEAISHIAVRVCANCAYVFSTKEDPQIGITEEIKPEDYFYLFDYDVSKMSVKQLIKRSELGNKKTGQAYKKGWVVYKLKERENPERWLREYAQEMGYRESWVKYQMKELNANTTT